ncbi:MAG: phosphoribosyltransferase [uncultured bacterium (gcode 4)]|uniref:Phosphoribosyltransferase n=1 Tax=uncultured bacterium (gcode 4) TaxID=1234023 RepID=K2H046_9BACT|nr:MAG: phosphoribosyltransferase [uncultured bacterium (gcode 4)]
MLRKILNFFGNIFLLPDEEKRYKKIFIDKTQHYRNELQEIYIDKVLVACEYEENIKNDLKKFKYEYNKKSLEKIVSCYVELYHNFSESGKPGDIIVTWIPLFTLNRLLRWYNQTYLIWESLAKKVWLDFWKLLLKPKYTKRQARLDKNRRFSNLKHCFKINYKYNVSIVWKTILLIDDVISTWTTSNEAARVLKESWAKEIIWLFLATWK